MEVAGPWWVGLGHKVDAREVLGGPGASVGPQMGRAGFRAGGGSLGEPRSRVSLLE